MSVKKLKNQIRTLSACLIAVVLVFGSLIAVLFSRTWHADTNELSLKKLNVKGEDGSLRMVLSNEQRQNPGVIDGRPLPKRERPAGIIFFDNNGNECGGLTFDESHENGTIHKEMSFTMDNYRNDQVVQLINDEHYQNGQASIRRGMAINEFPVGRNLLQYAKDLRDIRFIRDTAAQHKALDSLRETDGPKRRLFIGRTNENQSGLFLYDNRGRPRMQIFVDAAGNPQILSIDTSGNARKIISM